MYTFIKQLNPFNAYSDSSNAIIMITLI